MLLVPALFIVLVAGQQAFFSAMEKMSAMLVLAIYAQAFAAAFLAAVAAFSLLREQDDKFWPMIACFIAGLTFGFSMPFWYWSDYPNLARFVAYSGDIILGLAFLKARLNRTRADGGTVPA